VHRFPRRARRTPLKPFAQGRPGCPGVTCDPPVRVSFAHGIAGASRRPAFPAPSSGGRDDCKTRAEDAARMRRRVRDCGRSRAPILRHCERSEAIQTVSAERPWIASSQELLAMTSLADRGLLSQLSSPAKAGDPVFRDISDEPKGLGLRDFPPSRGTTAEGAATPHVNSASTVPSPSSSIRTLSPAFSQSVFTRLPVSTSCPACRPLPSAARWLASQASALWG